MAQFMMAHLADGQLGNARILKPETARLMHSRSSLSTTQRMRCVTGSMKNHATDIESSDTAAIRSTSTAICTWCWTRSSASLFRTTAPGAAAVREIEPVARVSGSLLSLHRIRCSFGDCERRRQSGLRHVHPEQACREVVSETASLISQFTVSPVGDGDIEIPQLTGANGNQSAGRQSVR